MEHVLELQDLEPTLAGGDVPLGKSDASMTDCHMDSGLSGTAGCPS
jgi:hypothetical protein